MFKGLNQLQFSKKFQSDDDCYLYLMEHKWAGGFKCVKCGHGEYYKGRTWHHRRCRKCMYDESVTANTVFHDLKMSVLQ
eukprot:gene58153-77597_t